MLPGDCSQLQGHIQPPAGPGSEGKPDASPGAGRSFKTSWGRSDKASGERMCLHHRKSLCILPAPVPSSARQNGARWLQYKMQRMGLLARSRHAAGFILNRLRCKAGGTGDLDAQLQERPSGTPPASATAFFPLPSAKALLYLLCLLLPRVWGTTCSVWDQPRPGPAQPDPDQAQQAPLAGAQHRPHPAPSAVQQGPLLQPSRDGSAGHSARSG